MSDDTYGDVDEDDAYDATDELEDDDDDAVPDVAR